MNDVMTDGEISFVKKAFNIAMSELAERHHLPDAKAKTSRSRILPRPRFV